MSTLNPIISGLFTRLVKAREALTLPARIDESVSRIEALNAQLAEVDLHDMKLDLVGVAFATGKVPNAALNNLLTAQLRAEVLSDARTMAANELPGTVGMYARESIAAIKTAIFAPAVEVLRNAAEVLPTGASIDTLARNGRHDLVEVRVAADRAVAGLKEAYDLRVLLGTKVVKADELVSKYTDPTAAAEILASTGDKTEVVLSLLRAGVDLVLLDADEIASAKRRRQAEYDAKREAAIRKIR